MYKVKLWDEDKWDIHSSNYSSSKHKDIFSDDRKEDKVYHEQKYGQKEKNDSDYVKKEDEREKEEKNKDISGSEEGKELREEEIPFKAAKQIFNESKHQNKKKEDKKDIKNIDDAIKKAIEEEKKVVIMDS